MYPYTDEDGTLLYQVVRTTPRGFYHRRPNGSGGWINNLQDTRRVVYRLPEVVAAVEGGEWVYVVEGEKDAESVAELGLAATTNSGGPGQWRPKYAETLRDALVAILPDNDDAGRKHAQAVADSLHGVAAVVCIVELPELPPGGDATDWIKTKSRQGVAPEEIRAELEHLVENADVWRPGLSEESGAESAEEPLRALWALGKDPTPGSVKRALERIAERLRDCTPLELQTARERAIAALKGKVSAPAKFVDAALGSVSMSHQRTSTRAASMASNPPYESTAAGLVHIKPTRDGELAVPLTNFTATIVGEVQRDDGVEVRRTFEVEAQHLGEAHQFEVGSREFLAMRWVTDKLGPQAIINAGAGIRDHTRAAIQYLSPQVEARVVFTHLGWRKIGDNWLYLHAGGAIGPVGTVATVEVDPPEQLSLYILPDPPQGEDLERPIQASLRCLRLLPDMVTLPAYSAIWRAPLGPSDFSVHLAGQTGEGKSELAALLAQHFGPGMDARNLPGAWSSTGNALEVLAFAAKDALLVVDDFAPAGTVQDAQHQHREAARLLRAKGNQAGRGRLRPDGTLQPSKAPRALIFSTGEDVPSGHSIRARLWVVEVPAGEMDWQLLTECQRDAREGLYAAAMAGYLHWLAPRYEGIEGRRRTRTAELRSRASATAQHRRTPSLVADLAFGMEMFLKYAREAGALTKAEAEELWDRTWKALGEGAALQAVHLEAANPVLRFVELLRSALVSGRAHVASEEGNAPQSPDRWGWREKTIGAGAGERIEWQPQGDQIGWLVRDDLYLDTDAAYGVAQRMAQRDGLSVSSRTLWKRLKEAGKLATTDETRQRNTVRVTLQGSRREVLHLRSAILMPGKPSQPSQPSRSSREGGLYGTVLRDGPDDPDEEPSQETVPEEAVDPLVSSTAGSVGTVGTVAQTPGSDSEEAWEDL